MSNSAMQRRAQAQNSALGIAGMVPGPVRLAAQGIWIANSLNPGTEITSRVLAPSETGSFQRRIQALQEDPFEQLKAGTVALAEAPPEIRKQYAQPLLQATFKAARERGLA
jgi:hypothetical protein